MGMCVRNIGRIFVFLAVLGFLAGCGAMDAILPSSGTYKVNVKVNNISLDELSFISSRDKVLPYFEEPVSGDPDVTGLMVYLKDSKDITVGYRVLYNIDEENGLEFKPVADSPEQGEQNEEENAAGEAETGETVTEGTDTDIAGTDETISENNEGENADTADETGSLAAADTAETAEDVTDDLIVDIEKYKTGDENEYIIPVKSLDNNLPYFPLPPNLPIDRYTIVYQVMGATKSGGNKTILSKTEKVFFYLADARFSFEGIMVHHPGVAASPQPVQKGSVIMLETKLDYDSRLEPYVIWYSGKNIISEGRYATGEGNLMWKVPDQSGFFSLCAEVLPLTLREIQSSPEEAPSPSDMLGYQKEISLLISTKNVEMHLLTGSASADLQHWYIFEADLTDSTNKNSTEKEIKPSGKNPLKWMAANGTYGLAVGSNDVYILPDTVIPYKDGENTSYQIISRYKPLADGVILSVQFGASSDTAEIIEAVANKTETDEAAASVIMNLSKNGKNLVLTLSSLTETISKAYVLPETTLAVDGTFATTTINFSVSPNKLQVDLIIIENNRDHIELVTNPISLKTEVSNVFRVTLGQKLKTPVNRQINVIQRQVFTAIWDELAIYRIPKKEVKANVANYAIYQADYTTEAEEQIESIDDSEFLE
jgi:hypothetical protein